MRIASGGIAHETNTFAAQPTTLEDFIRDSGGDPNFSPEAVEARFGATATPGGVVETSAYERLKALLLERL